MSLPYYRATAERTRSRVIGWTADALYSFEGVTVLAGDGAERTLEIGSVLGRRLFGAPVGAAVGGNTGNGALGAVTLGALAMAGVYRLACVVAATNSGVFTVTDPNGYRLADLTVGVAYDNGHFAVTLADGATDFDEGDAFTITVPKGDGKVVMIDFEATDGTARAAGVLADKVTAPDGVDAAGSALVRMGLVNAAQLLWPDGASNDEKAAALDHLKSLGILARTEA